MQLAFDAKPTLYCDLAPVPEQETRRPGQPAAATDLPANCKFTAKQQLFEMTKFDGAFRKQGTSPTRRISRNSGNPHTSVIQLGRLRRFAICTAQSLRLKFRDFKTSPNFQSISIDPHPKDPKPHAPEPPSLESKGCLLNHPSAHRVVEPGPSIMQDLPKPVDCFSFCMHVCMYSIMYLHRYGHTHTESYIYIYAYNII